MNDTSAGASSGAVTCAIVLGTPGAAFAILEVLDLLIKLDNAPLPHLWIVNIVSVVTAGGVLSVLTTPIGAVCAFLGRRSSGRFAVAARAVTIVALVGWLLFVAKYA